MTPSMYLSYDNVSCWPMRLFANPFASHKTTDGREQRMWEKLEEPA